MVHPASAGKHNAAVRATPRVARSNVATTIGSVTQISRWMQDANLRHGQNAPVIVGNEITELSDMVTSAAAEMKVAAHYAHGYSAAGPLYSCIRKLAQVQEIIEEDAESYDDVHLGRITQLGWVQMAEIEQILASVQSELSSAQTSIF